MIQFMNPMWLWGLTGLLIPIGIHLLNRKEGRTIYIGSIRHLRESDSAQFSSVRLNEILLLLLRCLLLALIVFFLAGLHINTVNTQTEKWLVIEPGHEQDASLTSLVDSLQNQHYQLRYLTENFPTSISSNMKPPLDYWALVEELKSKSLKDVIVVTYSYATHFKGKRISTSDNIHWILHEPKPKEFVAEAVAISGDSMSMRIANSTSDQTTFETRNVSKPAFNQLSDSISVSNDSIIVTIFSDAAFDYDRKIMMASLKAIQSLIPNRIITSTKPPGELKSVTSGWIIWLSKTKPATGTIKKSIGYLSCVGTDRRLLEPAREAQLHCDTENVFDWIITKRLNEELVLKENFTLALATILLENENKNVSVYDKRVLPEQLTWSSNDNETILTSSISSDDYWIKYLVIGILMILVAERWLAYKRNQ
jgi:hypothetical protein